MRFVIVLALLCCCCTSEQSTSASNQEEHLPPQDNKELAEPPITLVRQQMPFVQQHIKEEKLKDQVENPEINEHKIPEYIKKFIEIHIRKVLENFGQQKEQERAQAEINSFSGIPPIVIQKIETLKKDIKDIIKQVETHIPQVIDQQIDFKNKIKENNQSLNNEKQLTDQDVIAGEINDSFKKEPVTPGYFLEILSDNINENHNNTLSEDSISAKVPQKTSQQVVNEKTSKQRLPVIPSYIQDIVLMLHQHIPQVIEQQSAYVGRQAQQDSHKVPENVQGLLKPVHQHVPRVAELKKQVGGKKESVTPSGHIQEIHQHAPQAINQHRTSIENKTNAKQLLLPEHIKNILKQIHQHIPKVIDDYKHRLKPEGQKEGKVNDKDNSNKPLNIEGVVNQNDLQVLVPQVIHQGEDHLALEQNYYYNDGVSVFPQIAVPQTLHIHPIVQEVNDLTQYEIFKNTNIAPSPVQQVQKKNHISPVRTT